MRFYINSRRLKESNQCSLLIVDDNPGIRKLLQEALSCEGYIIATAASGQEALRHVQQALPDLVLMDIKMPGINGFELKQKLREINQNISIIVISGYTDQQEIKELITQEDVNYVLTKPFDLRELRRIIANLLKSKS